MLYFKHNTIRRLLRLPRNYHDQLSLPALHVGDLLWMHTSRILVATATVYGEFSQTSRDGEDRLYPRGRRFELAIELTEEFKA